MKKIFTLLAVLLVGGAVASAEGNVLLVGEGQDYTKIEDAVAAASEGSTIKVTTDVEWKAAITPSLNNLTIEAENGVTISCLMKNKRAITLNQALTITLKNLNLVYTEKDASTATLFESSKGGNMLKMENCKISNFKGTSNQGIISLKGGGKATLTDVTFENNSIVNSNMPDGVGEIFIGTSGSTLNGTTNGSITMEGNVSVYVGETFNPAPRADANSANDEVADAGNGVKLYFTKTRPENSDVVIGTDDTSLFNLQSSVYDLKGSIKNDEKRLIAVPKTQSGIAGVEADENAPVEYYNLNGVQVKADNMTPGVYVRRQGKNVTKVMVK